MGRNGLSKSNYEQAKRRAYFRSISPEAREARKEEIKQRQKEIHRQVHELYRESSKLSEEFGDVEYCHISIGGI